MTDAAGLEAIARSKPPVSAAAVAGAVPALALRTIPLGLRLAAAAKLLASVTDTADAVAPIVRAVTAGAGKLRTLERLIQLQCRVAKCRELDAIVAATEQRVKLKCPKCADRFRRPALIRHLWHTHRLVFDRGRAREPGPLVEAAVAKIPADASPESLDRVYALATQLYENVEPLQIHQAVLSRLGVAPGDLDRLARRAAEQHCGLCPTCFAAVPNPTPPLPPPLLLARGRLSGDGQLVVAPNRRDPRHRGVRAALVPAAAAALTAPFSPKLTMLCGLASGLTYVVGRLILKPPPDPDTAAVDAAWVDLVPRIGRSPGAVQFLTRLCRTSIGEGTSATRTNAVWGLVEQAAVLAGKGGPYLSLFAAVRVLQAWDAGQIGKDWAPALTGILAPLFRAEASPQYAEAAAAVLLGADAFADRDAARLRLMLAAEAFVSGLTSGDVASLGRVCPAVGRLLAGSEDWFRLLHEVWRKRTRRPWSSIGTASTVFEFAASPAAGRTLATYPDTLLVDRLEDPLDREFGPILIGRRGVTIADATTADPNATVEVEDGRNGGSVLIFGVHRLTSRRKLPRRVAATLRAWLRYRAEDLLTPGDGSTGPSARLTAVLAPLVTTCPQCRTRCLVRSGDVAIDWLG